MLDTALTTAADDDVGLHSRAPWRHCFQSKPLTRWIVIHGRPPRFGSWRGLQVAIKRRTRSAA